MSSDARLRMVKERLERRLGPTRKPLSLHQRRVVAAMFLATLNLMVLTFLVFTYLPRYDMPGDPLLADLDFLTDLAAWQHQDGVILDEAAPTRAVLENQDPEKVVYLERTVPLSPGRNTLQLSAEIGTEAVKGGDEYWKSARVFLVQIKRDGTPDWSQPHTLVTLNGTNDPESFSRLFEIPGSIVAVKLGLQLTYATGKMAVDQIRLSTLGELASFRLAAAALVCAWALLGFYVLTSVYESIADLRIRGWILGTLGLFGFGVFMPSTFRQELIDGLASGFGLVLENPDGTGHMLVFAALSFILRMGRPHDSLWLHFAGWLLLGAASEVLQLFTADRSVQFGDWTNDVSGTVIGLAAAHFLPRIRGWLELFDRRGKPFR